MNWKAKKLSGLFAHPQAQLPTPPFGLPLDSVHLGCFQGIWSNFKRFFGGCLPTSDESHDKPCEEKTWAWKQVRQDSPFHMEIASVQCVSELKSPSRMVCSLCWSDGFLEYSHPRAEDNSIEGLH